MARRIETVEQMELLDGNDLNMCEEMLRQLASAKEVCNRCKRINLPVDGAIADIEALETFYHDVIAEFRGPQAALPKPT